jgi:hypothetical protein
MANYAGTLPEYSLEKMGCQINGSPFFLNYSFMNFD